jgi:hypothetical protein
MKYYLCFQDIRFLGRVVSRSCADSRSGTLSRRSRVVVQQSPETLTATNATNHDFAQAHPQSVHCPIPDDSVHDDNGRQIGRLPVEKGLFTDLSTATALHPDSLESQTFPGLW